MKKLYILIGLIAGIVSFSIPGSKLGVVLFILGFSVVFGALVLGPVAFICALVTNAIGNAIIKSPIGSVIGNFGCSIVHFLLCNGRYVPRVKAQKQPAQNHMVKKAKAG